MKKKTKTQKEFSHDFQCEVNRLIIEHEKLLHPGLLVSVLMIRAVKHLLKYAKSKHIVYEAMQPWLFTTLGFDEERIDYSPNNKRGWKKWDKHIKEKNENK